MSAKIIADSISPAGIRLTTLEVVMHRFVLAEFNTHRVFSRNSASSRAIPVEKQLDKVVDNPAWPLVWAAEQPGMQGGNELPHGDYIDAKALFESVHWYTTQAIQHYLSAHPDKKTRLHKSLINRLLEPFMWHTVIVTATDWANFFNLRCDPAAQPEIRVAAEAMREAMATSEPRLLTDSVWHTPYIQPGEEDELDPFILRKVSAARCARVSYLTHDGLRDIEKDIELYDRLTSSGHWSPLEHVATPARNGERVLGNLAGYHQLRHWSQTTRV